MNTHEIKQKLLNLQNTQSLLEREGNSILEELKTLGFKDIHEAKDFIKDTQEVDIIKLKEDILNLEKDINDILK